MSNTSNRPSAALLAALAIAGRLLPHLPNFTPVGAAAIFGGAKLSRPWNYLLPVFVLLVTDLFLGWHGTMPYVYASFIFMVWLGERGLSKNSSIARIGSYSVLGSVVFFLVTNLGVWAGGTMYPPTLSGLVSCYVAAIPFFGATLAGDLIYTLGFFGLYALAEKRQFIAQFDNKLLAWLR